MRDSLTGRVLLAEDSRDNQLLIANLLRKWGLTVDVASDGREAVAAAHPEDASDAVHGRSCPGSARGQQDACRRGRARGPEARAIGVPRPVSGRTRPTASFRRAGAERAR